MNFLRHKVKDEGIGVCIADDPDALDAFVQPGCAAAIWRRQMPRAVHSWLEHLDPDALPRARVVLAPGEVAETVEHLFDEACLPAGSERDWLAKDIARQADIFSGLLGAAFLRLRLDVVTTNACRRFHIDAITARLVCTYRGTGTHYGISENGADPKRVFTVQTGSPILLRGTLWSAKPASGLLHRSPPIQGTGETRLVLVLDPMAAPDDER